MVVSTKAQENGRGLRITSSAERGGEGGGESAESAAEIRSRCDNHRDETERQAELAGADAAAAAANGDRAEGLLADDERHGPLRKLRRLAGQSAHPHRDQGILLRSVLSDLYCT